MTKMTPEMEKRIENMKIDLIQQITETQTDKTISREDVAYLVDLYTEHRKNGMQHGEAARVTYGCLYQSTDITFNPRKMIAQLRNHTI